MGTGLTNLGSYLLSSLVFIFFTMLEFALVLILKEVNERRAYETIQNKDESQSKKVDARHLTELENNVAQVLPLQEMNHDLKTGERAGGEQIISCISRTGFFANLPLTRKLDIFAFVTYNMSYLFYNLYYWNNMDSK